MMDCAVRSEFGRRAFGASCLSLARIRHCGFRLSLVRRSFFWYLELIDSFESCQVKVLTISKPRYSLAYVFAEHRLLQGEIGRIPPLSTSTTNREFDYEY